MDRTSPHDGSSPSDSIRHPHDLTPFRLPGNAWQTMAEPLRIDQHARVCHRTQSRPAAKTGRHRWVVFRLCDGVVAVDAAGCVVAPRLCPLSLSLGYRRYRGICSPQCHFIWCHLLPFHCHRGDDFRELPISNPCRPFFSAISFVTSYPHFVQLLQPFLVLFLPASSGFLGPPRPVGY